MNEHVFDSSKNLKQQEFIEQVLRSASGKSDYKYFFFGGAIRGGKTYSGLASIILLAKKFPRSRCHVIRDSFPNLESTTLISLERFKLNLRWNRDKGNYYCEFSNRARIYFMAESFDRDPDLDRFKGLETNFFFLEQIEELQQTTWQKCLERVGSWYIDPMPPGICLATFNPSQTWIKEHIHDKWIAGELHLPYYYLTALPTDNPFVTQEQFDQWKHLDPLNYQRFVEGNWDAFAVTNQWLYAFDDKQHISEKAIFDSRQTVYISFDFNINPCTAILFHFGRDYIHIFDEVRLESGGIYEVTARIKSKYEKCHILITGDASGFSGHHTQKGNLNSYLIILTELMLKNNQLQAPRFNPALSESRTLCNSIFARHPGVLINPLCKWLINDLKFCTAIDGDQIEKKAKHLTHLLDCLRYGLNTFKGDFLEKRK